MSFKPFKALTTLINGLKNKGTVLPGRNIPSFKTIASNQGIINYNPTNADYTSASHTSRNNFYVYPVNHEDQEHYMLFDIIERVAEDGGNMQIVTILPSGELKTLVKIEGQDDSEVTGPAFDPSGTRLYFSSQRGTGGSDADGITYEVSGPFHRLA